MHSSRIPARPEERFRLFASCLQKCLFRRFSFLCFLLVCGHHAALRGRGGRKKLPASGACPASLPDALRLPRPTNENQHKRGCRMSTFLVKCSPLSRRPQNYGETFRHAQENFLPERGRSPRAADRNHPHFRLRSRRKNVLSLRKTPGTAKHDPPLIFREGCKRRTTTLRWPPFFYH